LGKPWKCGDEYKPVCDLWRNFKIWFQ
jgi:hypothetical protein